MKRVLFLCTHNAVRSQMAEGILRHRYGAAYDVYSAGTCPQGVHPLAIRVMEEIGIDVAGHASNPIEEFFGKRFDLVATVCDNAASACPSFPGAEVSVHRSFSDPSRVSGSEADVLAAFRNTRDEIASWIEETFRPLPNGSDAPVDEKTAERGTRG